MRKLLISLLIVFFSTAAFAQWRRAGIYGADARALILDPANPDTLYLGTSQGEVYVSRDGAKHWANPRGNVPFPGYVVDSLVIDRQGRLWAGCWGLWGGGVIAYSDDGAKSWHRRDAGLEDFSVRAIAVDPRDASFILAGGPSGVYRSVNGGEAWERISEQTDVESLAIDPRTHDRIYAGTRRQGLRTDDGGKHWKLINNGMVLDTDVFAISIDARNPDHLWVSTCGWVYSSADRGENWIRYRDGFNNRRIHAVALDPNEKNHLYAGSVAGLYRSGDGGKSWVLISDESLVVNSVLLDPRHPGRLILGTEGDGVYVSNDAGKTYQRSSDGLYNVRITTIASDPSRKSHVYAAVVFGGASSGLYESEDAGATWARISSTNLPAVLSLGASEDDAEVKLVAGTEKGFFWSADGKTWTPATPNESPIRVDKVVRLTRARWFAATSEGVFTSRDGGKSWYRLGDAANRAIDLAVGSLAGKPALFALTDGGVIVFDGTAWFAIDGAPPKGRTIAMRTLDGSPVVFVAGVDGVHAGRVGPDLKWREAEAPGARYASVYGCVRGTEQLLFVTSRQQREILVGQQSESDWYALSLPSRNTDVTAIAPDPFDVNRFYVGTLGQGVMVFEGRTRKYVASVQAGAEPGYLSAGSK
ncbi:MAG TPA: YCF48-related protein [Thermoanaerobaculia bacterium]|nr:YCF48-related protein [Thermoanaerobaculia bacterium]